MGAMPMVGDFCVVGWASANSENTASGKFPRILAYFPPPMWMARDWLPAQDFSQEEMPHGLEGVDRYVEGLAGRVRFKLRHAEPGNIVMSSAQGADLVLDDDAAVEAGGSSQRDLDAMIEEAGASRPQGRMAVVNADTLRMLAEERERGDAGPRPREKKRRRKKK